MKEEVLLPEIVPSGEVDLPVAVEGEIYESFLQDGRTIRELSKEYGIPLRQLSAVAKRGDWLARRAALELEEITKREEAYRKFVIDKKLPTAEQHLETSNALICAIEDLIANIDLSVKGADMTLMRLSKALKDASDAGARASGMTDTPITDHLRQREKEERTPLVIVGVDARPV